MGNPPLGSLADPFTAAALNTTVWNGSMGPITVVPALGMAQLACPTTAGSFNTLGANGPYDATGQALFTLVTPVLRGNGGTKTIVKLQVDASNSVAMRLEQGVFKFTLQIAGTTTTTTLPAYDPTQHAWWRLRESAGTWYAETSADGYAWTTLASGTYSWSPTAVLVVLQASATDTEPSGLFAGFQHLNTMVGPSGLMPSWPQIRFQVAFNTGAQMTSQPAYVDLSSRLRGSWSAALAGRQYELDQVQSGQLTLTLANTDGALDPTNTASLYAPNVLPMRPCRLQAVWPPTRNMLPQDRSNGTAPSSSWYAYAGTPSPATGLSPAPTGHTTATAWQFPVTASAANTFPLLTGTTGGSAEAMSFPVVAGLPYTWSAWASRSSGGDATLGITQEILWYDKTGAQLSGTGGTLAAVPVQGAWAQNTISGTAPAGAVVARIGTWLTNTATTAVNTIYLTGMQLEQAAAVTPWVAGGVVYALWAGFVERWPQQWNFSGTYGLVDLTCIDALAGLAQFTLQPNFGASLQSLGPSFMYALNDVSGSTTFADTVGKQPARFIANSIKGGGTATITAGNSIQGSGSVGSSGPVVTVTNPNWGQTTPQAGKFIDSHVLQAPPTSGGWTRIICFRTTNVPASGNWMALWVASGPAAYGNQAWYNGSEAVAGLYVNSSQKLYGFIQDRTGTYSYTITVPDVSVCDGNWHIAVMQLSSDGKTLTVGVDDFGYYYTLASGAFTPSGCTADTIGAAANNWAGACNGLYQGDLAFATQIPYAIGNNEASDLSSGFATGWAGELSGSRMERILLLAGYQGAWGYEGAAIAMGGANLGGTDPVSALTLVGDTEAGQIYADGANTIWMTGRLWRYLQPNPTVTFGENQAAGEVPYLGDVAMDFDTTHIYNIAQVTQVVPPGFTQPPDVYVPNNASEQAYLPRTVQRSINTNDPTLQLAAGQYLASQYGQPMPRLAALNIDVAANPALWATVLALGFGTRAQVNRRPPTGPGAAAISVQQFVEHITWNGDDQGNFKVALQLTPATPYLNWGVAASLHTTVATASTAGTATVTLGALTGAAGNPASAVLAPGTVLTLSYGTANAEQLTVKSVAATSAGYSSVAVTFTTNSAFNHAVGDVVCQPLPANYAMPAATLAGFPSSLDAVATISATGPRAAY